MKLPIYNKDKASANGETKSVIFSHIPINSGTKISCNQNYNNYQEKEDFGGFNRSLQGTNSGNKISTAKSKNIIWDKKILDSLVRFYIFY